MDQRLWAKIEGIFHAVLELPPHQCPAYLAAACDGDDDLLREVRQLLEHDEKSTALVDTRPPNRYLSSIRQCCPRARAWGHTGLPACWARAEWALSIARKIRGSAAR